LGDVAPEKLKPIAELLPLQPLPMISCDFIDWVAGYCMAPVGAVLRMAMSVPEALEPERALKGWTLGDEKAAKLTPARARVFDVLREGPPLPPTELARAAAVSAGVIAEMGRLGQLCAVPLALVTEAKRGAWSSSWSAPRPQPASGARPPKTTSGAPLKWAWVTGLRALVTPGPAVTTAKPGVRVSFPTASAAKTALASCRTSTIRRRWRPRWAAS